MRRKGFSLAMDSFASRSARRGSERRWASSASMPSAGPATVLLMPSLAGPGVMASCRGRDGGSPHGGTKNGRRAIPNSQNAIRNPAGVRGSQGGSGLVAGQQDGAADPLCLAELLQPGLDLAVVRQQRELVERRHGVLLGGRRRHVHRVH